MAAPWFNSKSENHNRSYMAHKPKTLLFVFMRKGLSSHPVGQIILQVKLLVLKLKSAQNTSVALNCAQSYFSFRLTG
jgi:hypothetical protein